MHENKRSPKREEEAQGSNSCIKFRSLLETCGGHVHYMLCVFLDADLLVDKKGERASPGEPGRSRVIPSAPALSRPSPTARAEHALGTAHATLRVEASGPNGGRVREENPRFASGNSIGIFK